MHLQAFNFVAAAIRRRAARGPVYEIGSRNINGTVRHLFDRDVYHGIDLVAGPGVDAVGDAATYTPPCVPQTVVCCEVLEHTPLAEEIVRRVATVLPSGGVAILTMAGPGRPPHSAADGGPVRSGEFYRNVTPALLASWLTAFQDVEIVENPEVGDLYATAVKP